MSHFVYILYSRTNDSFYKGQTDDLEDRIHRHNKGWEKATRSGAPWILVWAVEKTHRSAAVILESKLKNLSRKRLINFILKNGGTFAGPDALTALLVRGQDAD